jgi:exodeoxyribonuclease VII large subunit
VIASVGHHTDRPLIDDVAALACSTPTHAAEAAVPVAPALARDELAATARRLTAQGRHAVRSRAAVLGHLARAPQHHLRRHRDALARLAGELSAGADRAAGARRRAGTVAARDLERATRRAEGTEATGRRRDLDRLLLALAAHDPARTLARGYAIVESAEGEPIGAAAEAEAAGRVNLRFADGVVGATVDARAAAR